MLLGIYSIYLFVKAIKIDLRMFIQRHPYPIMNLMEMMNKAYLHETILKNLDGWP